MLCLRLNSIVYMWKSTNKKKCMRYYLIKDSIKSKYLESNMLKKNNKILEYIKRIFWHFRIFFAIYRLSFASYQIMVRIFLDLIYFSINLQIESYSPSLSYEFICFDLMIIVVLMLIHITVRVMRIRIRMIFNYLRD
ncbi:MAG: hypothetical protein Ta2E_01990 [Mycoplasmoidaceae bacterium]|nr:MAG: hypothetical protein Ta2E_01990 [Mycoplasmoidaceae bacterium]